MDWFEGLEFVSKQKLLPNTILIYVTLYMSF